MPAEPYGDCSRMSTTLDKEAPDLWTTAGKLTWGRYLEDMEADALQTGFQHALAGASDAIDIGSETGRWTRRLLDHGFSVTSTEVCVDKIAGCQARNPEANCVLVSPDDTRLPVDDNSMDFAVSIEVEVNDFDWFVPELRRVLREGGVAVFTLNNRSSYRGWTGNIKSRLRNDEIYYPRSHRNMCNQLAECGFEIIAANGFGWFPFGRFSNSSLVPLATKIEDWLQLRRFVAWSPWIAYVCRFNSQAESTEIQSTN